MCRRLLQLRGEFIKLLLLGSTVRTDKERDGNEPPSRPPSPRYLSSCLVLLLPSQRLIAGDPASRDDIGVVLHDLSPIGHEVLVDIVLVDEMQIGAGCE